jgi:hypothetical protein
VTAEILIANEEEGVSVVGIDHQLRIRDQLGKGPRVDDRKDGIVAAAGDQSRMA